mmetsp:Transcript_16745/g.31579  ORF Transcript_16745/g.31579 Transcript_16745/m.31579 type:complete len:202 (+) Transcript_16745:275-880(+)
MRPIWCCAPRPCRWPEACCGLRHRWPCWSRCGSIAAAAARPGRGPRGRRPWASLDDENRQLGVGEHLLCLAAQQQCGNAAAAVGGHHDEVDRFGLGMVEDGFPGVQGLDGVRAAGQALSGGGSADGFDPLGGDAPLGVDELLWRHRLDLRDRGVREGLHHAERQQLGAMQLGKLDGGVRRVGRDVGTIGRDEDALEHEGLR